ncbi:PP2C family protein-serine/threonine phosphatase [Streptomyces sp. AS58]|uniref:PP2C family protein-serine/threonine phosphatase n=1 Tax=Streptomyces sp. AS58 TaxID=1519489 RepID=UPI0006AEFF99|nr:PP2C family protein-serine/threonine phosphatase [Streptomyces sp. AS58]
MTHPEYWDDQVVTRLERMAGALLGVVAVCTAVPLRGRAKAACRALRLLAAPAAVAACGRLLGLYRRRAADAFAVSDAVQGVLLRRLPPRVGSVNLASVYRACGGRARVGGDLYAVVRSDAATRIIIGDVRGRGLPSFHDVIAIVAAFREWAPQPISLVDLSARLEESFVRYLSDADDDANRDTDERFATALILEFPDSEPDARMVNFGHPPPVRARAGKLGLLPGTPCAPLGLSSLRDLRPDESSFELGPHDTLLLYTDGLIEARDRNGKYFPFVDRATKWTWHDPHSRSEDRLHNILGEILVDIVVHCGALPADDLAMIALARHPDSGQGALPHPAEPDPSEGTGRIQWC